MKEPRGFLAVITDYDALPILIAISEIAVVSRLPPSELSGAKASILLRAGERLLVGTGYATIVERLALSVGTDEMREGN